jgi:uncharacterized protein YlxP (DUF503 family)
MEVMMKKGENPVTLFKQISRIKNKYNMTVRKINEEDLIAIGCHIGGISSCTYH